MSISGNTTSDIPRHETSSLIASDKVEGTAVYNGRGEHLGKINNLMLEKQSGQVSYAVLSFGGFLGMGNSYYPVPWNMLSYDTRQGGYQANLTREQLEGAPRYEPSSDPNWSDPMYLGTIDRFYGGMGPHI